MCEGCKRLEVLEEALRHIAKTCGVSVDHILGDNSRTTAHEIETNKVTVSDDIFSLTDDERDGLLFSICGYDSVQDMIRHLETEDLRLVRRFFVAIKKLRSGTIGEFTAKKYAKFIVDTYAGKVECGDQIRRFNRLQWRDMIEHLVCPLIEEKRIDSPKYYSKVMLGYIDRNLVPKTEIAVGTKNENIADWSKFQ